jgi:hypothetical protein
MNTLADERSRARRIRWKTMLAVVVFALVAWLAHPPVLAWLLRLAMNRAASEVGLQFEVGEVYANLSRPIVFDKVRIRSKDPEASQTAVNAARVQIVLGWSWRTFVGTGRMLQSADIEDVRGVLDFRRAGPSSGESRPQSSAVEEGPPIRWTSRWLPKEVALRRANLEFIGVGQSYYFEAISAESTLISTLRPSSGASSRKI